MAEQKTAPKVRNYFSRERVVKLTAGESRTQQHFKRECDINNIMAKYQKTGLITHYKEHGPRYGDFIGFQDYQTSMNQILDANEAFESLPATVRKRFQNDPSRFLEFIQDADNVDEMIEMGLAERRPMPPDAQPRPPQAPEPAAE